ncbi:MAG: hypothetical protein J6T59_08245 [Bacteroidales bacterium]|nr:hypothetical protein [Bacteroidales bacterium]
MKSARSVRPLTAAANVNKNAGRSKKDLTPKALHFCKRKRLCTPLLEAGHSRRVRLTMSAFPPTCSMAKYFLDSTMPVCKTLAMALGRTCAGSRFPVGDTDR